MKLININELINKIDAYMITSPDVTMVKKLINECKIIEDKEKCDWRPIKFRGATAEEIAEHETNIVYDCVLPDDGDEVLVTLSYRNRVTMTEFYHDGEYCGFEDYDYDDVIAWRPLPEPYMRGEE